jgi:hypothetical protein
MALRRQARQRTLRVSAAPTTVRFVPIILGCQPRRTTRFLQLEGYYATADEDERRKYCEEYDFEFRAHRWLASNGMMRSAEVVQSG